jgi:hypothetical protein
VPKFQFRAVPPNGDIVLNHAGSGYEAVDSDMAWRMLYQTLYAKPEDTELRLRMRYICEPLGTLPRGAF